MTAFAPKTFDSRLPWPARFKILGGILIVAALVVYLGLEIKKIITPPEIIIFKPANNLVISDPFVEINGKTEKESALAINDYAVLADSNGYFKEVLNLTNGLNIIKISASKKHSKERVVWRQIIVEEKENLVTKN